MIVNPYKEQKTPSMMTAITSRSNPLRAALLGALALATPACLAGPDDDAGAGAADGSHVPPDFAAVAASKPVPVRPAMPSADELAAKPRDATLPPREPSSFTFTVGLSAGPTNLWPTQFSSLTAFASSDVGPTPFYIRIREVATGALLVSCGTGVTCPTSVTQPTDISVAYVASIEDFAGNVQATSPVAVVNWFGTSLNLTPGATTVPVGGSTTLVATTARDIGPSPFFTEIFDATTATLLAICGSGTSCSATVSQAAATTHTYRAFLSPASSTFPPPGAQRTTGLYFVTWASSGLSVSLSAPVFVSTFTQSVTATANIDVGPTPYWIEIFDQTTGTRVAVCGSGTTCTATIPATTSTSDELVAFISSFSTDLPPVNAQAASNIVFGLLVLG